MYPGDVNVFSPSIQLNGILFEFFRYCVTIKVKEFFINKMVAIKRGGRLDKVYGLGDEICLRWVDKIVRAGLSGPSEQCMSAAFVDFTACLMGGGWRTAYCIIHFHS